MKLAIKKEKIIKLFEYLGYKTAGKWDIPQLNKKIKQLPETTDGVKITNPKIRKFLEKILNADSIRIKSVEDENETEMENEQMSKKKNKDVKKDVKKGEKKVKKAEKKGEKKVGVIASILEFIKDHGPISKKQILVSLVKRFPDRLEESMGKTIGAQVPGRLNAEKSAKIKKNDKDKYYIK